MRALTGFCIFICYIFVESTPEGYTITPINTSSGLYYEKIGDVLLSNGNWEFVTSVDYAGYLLFHQYLHQQAENLQQFCREYQSENCDKRYATIRTSLDSIERTDEIMANFLGIESKRRVKRFWQAALTIVAPYVLQPLADGLTKTIFGDNINEDHLKIYDQEIYHLKNTQKEIINQLEAQRTMFLIDSERKGNQVKYLKRMQDGIRNELKIFQSTFSKDSEEKEKKIKDLTDMLYQTQQQLKLEEEKQQKLTDDVVDIQEDVKDIHDDIKSIKEEITANKNDINTSRIETKLNTISINFNFLLSRFESEQKTLLDVITNANRGFLDPYIITSVNLIDMLREVQSMLPENSRLPFHPNFENARSLYTIITPTVCLHNDKIVFVLQIPLVHIKTFDIYKMTSLPMPLGEDKFIFILPKKEYLLVNDKHGHTSEYVLTSAMDFREVCRQIGRGKHLCEQFQQTSAASSTNVECEAQLFLGGEVQPGRCNCRVMKPKNTMFIQLQQQGSWIYVAPKPENLILSCGNGRGDEQVRGTGILRLSKNCTARTSSFALRSITSTTVTTVFSPDVDLTKYIDTASIEDFVATVSDNHKQIISPFELGELNDVSTRIDDIKNNHVQVADYNVTIMVVVVVIAVTLMIVVFRKIICKFFDGSLQIGGKRDTEPSCGYLKKLNNDPGTDKENFS